MRLIQFDDDIQVNDLQDKKSSKKLELKDDSGKKPELKDYTGWKEDRPEYVIFSHCWLPQREYGGDITFQEFNNSKARKDVNRKDAFDKLNKAIEMAKKVGAAKEVNAKHIWIDSCCINKESSSELSEALNSMYSYYAEAKLCIVYLHDFRDEREKDSEECDFSNEKWFQRGWTLQELIAPKEVIFYDKEWKQVGTRDKLAGAIRKVTNIPEELLRTDRKKERFDYSVAQRMSWAAKRKTTREEDMSYSLFGLFDVNLPPIYGEGARNAFLRLQEEIMRKTNDMSLFAWRADPSEGWEYSGILARSPKEFKGAGDIERLGHNPEFSMTNKGLKIRPQFKESGRNYLMSLNCARNGSSEHPLSIMISDGKNGGDMGVFHRKCDYLAPVDGALSKWEKPMYIIRDERYLRTSRTSPKNMSTPTKTSRANRGSLQNGGEPSKSKGKSPEPSKELPESIKKKAAKTKRQGGANPHSRRKKSSERFKEARNKPRARSDSFRKGNESSER